MIAPDRRLKSVDAAHAKRKLTAILAADVAGYSRLMGADEAGTHATLTAYLSVLAGSIAEHDGRIVGTAGDSVLADFPSVVEALNTAVEIQKEFAERNAELPAERRLRFRIGINLGDVIVDGEDIFGDGVNVAARVQDLAEPGGVAISGPVYDQVRNKLDLGFRNRGTHRVKNITEPVRVYDVLLESAAARRTAQVARGLWLVARAAGAAMVVLAVVLTVWLRWPETRRADQAEPSGLTEAGTPGDLLQPSSAFGVKPTIAVLPFDNQGRNPEQDYFSEGITEDIISALGRFSSLLVMSWDAVAPYKGQTIMPDQLSEDLDVRYVVNGSVRRAGDQLRVTTRLTDAKRGVLLWSERYDRAVDDVFAVQDDITRQIVSTLAIRVTYLEQERAFGKATDNLNAYDYYLRGRKAFRQFTRSGNVRAQELFERAIELDPNYGDAHAALAWTYTKSAEMGWSEWPQEALKRAHDLAQAAVRLDPSNQLAHILLAIVYTYHQNYELALEELDRATEANPNHAGNHAERAWVLLLGGRSRDAITALEEAVRFDPSPTPNTFSNLAMAYISKAATTMPSQHWKAPSAGIRSTFRSTSRSLLLMPRPGGRMMRRGRRRKCAAGTRFSRPTCMARRSVIRPSATAFARACARPGCSASWRGKVPARAPAPISRPRPIAAYATTAESAYHAFCSCEPSIVSGNTNAPTIMLAEKAADLIRGREPLEPIDVPVYIALNWESAQR